MFTLEKKYYFQIAIIGIQKLVGVKYNQIAINQIGILWHSFQSSNFLIENSVVFE